MQLNTLILCATIAFTAEASAARPPHGTPTPTFITPPPPGESASSLPLPPLSSLITNSTPAYVTGYPICGIPGYTVIPGLYNETIEQQSGSNLDCCLDKCRANSTCYSIAYAPHYTECLFFDRIVEDTQLTADNSSYFVHYDLKCRVG